MRLFTRKTIGGFASENFTGSENRTREFRVIRAVREVLRFHCERRAGISHGEKLQGWLVGEAFNRHAAFQSLCDRNRLFSGVLAKHKGVVIPVE